MNELAASRCPCRPARPDVLEIEVGYISVTSSWSRFPAQLVLDFFDARRAHMLTFKKPPAIDDVDGGTAGGTYLLNALNAPGEEGKG